MPAIIKITHNGFRDMRGRFARLSDPAAADRARDYANRAAQLMSQALAAEAPNGKPDPLGRPRPVGYRKLRENIRALVDRTPKGYKTRVVGPVQARFVIGGTRPHLIPRGGSEEMKAKGYPLHFYWLKKRMEVWFWSVNHPGTQPNRFDLRAMARVKERVIAEAQKGAAKAYIEPLFGGKR